jgi:MFS transporter, PHS family, inorganic phosphate transporter
MLTIVFLCQPLGQLGATLVTLIAAVNQRGGIPSDSTLTNCNSQCKQTLDSVWRWIIGVGVIPAVIALWFRLTIIESPRYTADVGRDSRKAASELDRYLLEQARTAASSTTSVNVHPENRESYPLGLGSSGAVSVAESAQRSYSPSPYEISQSPGPSTGNGISGPYLQKYPSGAVSEVGSTSRNRSPGNPAAEAEMNGEEDENLPPPPSWKDFKKYFWHDGNLRTLIATCFCWFCLDLPFYGLGMNNPRIIGTIWYGKNVPTETLYSQLVNTVWQTLIVVSLGAIVGTIITFVAIDRLGRRNIQIIGFFWLFILFIVIGGSFNHLYEMGSSSAIIVLYILCQIFFNFGKSCLLFQQ